MKELNLNLPIFTEKGIPEPKLKGETIGTAIAKLLMHESPQVEEEISNYYRWAKYLGKNELLKLNSEEIEKFLKWIIGHTEVHVIVKGPVVEALNKLKQAKKE